MSRSTLASLLLRARDLESASGRWIWSLVTLLLLFQAGIVTPFVASSQRREAASLELHRLEGVAAGLEAMEPLVVSSSDFAQEVMAPALDQLVDDVAAGLLRLRATRQSLRRLVAAQRSAGGGGDGESNEDEVTTDQREDELVGVEPFQVENIDYILAIAEAETPDEIRAALTPLVERHIGVPLFSDLEQLWISSAAPRIEATLDDIAGRVPELRGRFSEDSAAWENLARALLAQRRAVRDLPWQPPERDGWWWSGGQSVAMPGLEPAVREELRRPLALDQFQATAAQAESSYRRIRGEVDGRFEALRLEAQSGGLPEIVSRLGVARLARAFPLVLGIAFAAVIVAAARRRREVGLLVHLLIREGEAGALLDWYHQRFLWRVTPLSRTQGAVAAWKASRLRLLALASLSFAWTGFSSAQLWDIEPPERLLVLTTLGGGALLMALIYDFTVARRLTVLLSEAVGGELIGGATWPGNNPDGEGEGDEPLNGHDLRR